MGPKAFVLLAAISALFAADVASADPSGAVDRERLKKAAPLPRLTMRSVYAFNSDDSGEEQAPAAASAPDVAKLRAELKGDDDDAERWSTLAEAYLWQGDAEHETECRLKAVDRSRRRAAAHPDDGGNWAKLALVLVEANDDKGADEALEHAVGASREPWRGWAARGSVEVMRGCSALAKRRLHVAEAFDWMRTAPEMSAVDAEADKLFVSGVGCYAKAVEIAPNEVELRMGRFMVRSLCARRLGAASLSGDEWLSDFRKIAEVRPNDPRALAVCVMIEAMVGLEQAGVAVDGPFSQYPDSVKARFVDVVARLAKLAKADDRALAARALEATGVLEFAMQDFAAAEAALRQALALNPRLRDARASLVALLVRAGRWEDLSKACRDWLTTAETASKRMILAKAEDKLGHAAESEKQWRAALALDPKSFEANAGVAASVLRRALGDEELKEARTLLAACGTPREPEKLTTWSELSAVLLGLSGDVDGAEKLVREILQRDEHDESAREILVCVGR